MLPSIESTRGGMLDGFAAYSTMHLGSNVIAASERFVTAINAYGPMRFVYPRTSTEMTGGGRLNRTRTMAPRQNIRTVMTAVPFSLPERCAVVWLSGDASFTF